jgi:biotin transport system substrate-specific component
MGLSFSLRGIVFSALFAALLAVLSLFNVSLGFSPIPISLENLVIMLAGALLGARYGFISIGLVIVLTALGFPLLHGTGGLALILGPTGGFIWAYPFSALLIGFFISRIKSNGLSALLLSFFIMEIFGSLMLYVTGVPWLSHVAGVSLSKALVLGCYPFLLGDAIKAFIAALIVLPVRQVFSQKRLVGAKSAIKS